MARKGRTTKERPLFDMACDLVEAGVDPHEVRRQLREAGATELSAEQDTALAIQTQKIKALLGR